MLLLLKDILVVLGGIETEGIFRRAGLESEMATLKTKIENGEPFHSQNPHTIATLIKVSIDSIVNVNMFTKNSVTNLEITLALV